jgi:hypothetical protein
MTDLIYKCGGIDKRTIEKFEKVSLHSYTARDHNDKIFLPRHPAGRGAISWWGFEISDA